MDTSKLTFAVFTLGGEDGHCFAGFHDPAITWNGFACPYIYQHEVERMRVLWVDDHEISMDEAIADTKMPEDSPFLPIGSHGWTWEIAPMGEGREFLLQPIRTLAQAEAFCLHLEKQGLMWHFDDAPCEIISGATGKALFTDAEAAAADCRAWELREIMDDPFSLPVALTNCEDGKIFRLQWLEGNGQNFDPEQDTDYLITSELAEKLGPVVSAFIGEMIVTETASPLATDKDHLPFSITRIQ